MREEVYPNVLLTERILTQQEVIKELERQLSDLRIWHTTNRKSIDELTKRVERIEEGKAERIT